MSRFLGVEEKYSLSLGWDLDIDLNNTATNVEIPTETRFGGDWKLSVIITEPRRLQIRLSIVDTECGAVGTAVSPLWKFSWVEANGRDEHLIDKEESRFADAVPQVVNDAFYFEVRPEKVADASEHNRRFNPLTHRRFLVEFDLQDMSIGAVVRHALLPKQLALGVAPSLSSRRPDQIRLFFPRVGAELWVNSALLVSASPYFKTLLESSSFAENVRRGRKRARTGPVNLPVSKGAPGTKSSDTQMDATPSTDVATAGAVEEPMTSLLTEDDLSATVEDSDDETDDLARGAGHLKLEEVEEDGGDYTYRQIDVLHTCYSTYRAVILWMQTSYLDFSQLRSHDLTCQRKGGPSRSDYIAQLMERNPTLPLPVSPKSVYRLAHLLEIPQLQALAIADLKLQLMVDVAATELFSSTSTLYDEVRATILDFVAAHWTGVDGVKESEGMKEINRRIREGELPLAGSTFTELLMAVA